MATAVARRAIYPNVRHTFCSTADLSATLAGDVDPGLGRQAQLTAAYSSRRMRRNTKLEMVDWLHFQDIPRRWACRKTGAVPQNP